jgi:hypothetical protein
MARALGSDLRLRVLKVSDDGTSARQVAARFGVGISSAPADRITAPFVYDGAMNGNVFRAYVEQALVPMLAAAMSSSWVIYPPKAASVPDAIEATGGRLLYLPPYNSRFNPIENAFAKLKAMMQAKAQRTIAAPWNAVSSIANLFNPTECANYFRAAGCDPD